MKNFDSVPQLQCLSCAHHCAARSHHGSHSRQCRHSLLQRQLAALLQCGPAGHGFGGLFQQLQTRVQNPWCGLSMKILTEQWIESNRLVCGTDSNRIESFSFLPSRPSLVCSNAWSACRHVWSLNWCKADDTWMLSCLSVAVLILAAEIVVALYIFEIIFPNLYFFSLGFIRSDNL